MFELLVALGFAASNALGEELAFRGVIQGAMEVTLQSRAGAIIFQWLVRLWSGGLLAVWIAHVVADLTIVGLIVWS